MKVPVPDPTLTGKFKIQDTIQSLFKPFLCGLICTTWTATNSPLIYLNFNQCLLVITIIYLDMLICLLLYTDLFSYTFTFVSSVTHFSLYFLYFHFHPNQSGWMKPRGGLGFVSICWQCSSWSAWVYKYLLNICYAYLYQILSESPLFQKTKAATMSGTKRLKTKQGRLRLSAVTFDNSTKHRSCLCLFYLQFKLDFFLHALHRFAVCEGDSSARLLMRTV